jgi:hypothetical protein
MLINDKKTVACLPFGPFHASCAVTIAVPGPKWPYTAGGFTNIYDFIGLYPGICLDAGLSFGICCTFDKHISSIELFGGKRRKNRSLHFLFGEHISEGVY